MRRLAAAVVVAIVMFALVALAVPATRTGLATWYTWRGTEPDMSVRSAISQVKPADIMSVELVVLPGRITVRDADAVRLLLTGLQQASSPRQNLKYQLDRVTIVLKGGKRVGPFPFSTRREVDSFSPEFVEGLRKAGIKVPR